MYSYLFWPLIFGSFKTQSRASVSSISKQNGFYSYLNFGLLISDPFLYRNLQAMINHGFRPLRTLEKANVPKGKEKKAMG